MSVREVGEVEAANAEFYAAFESSDLERMRELWDDADDTTCIHPGWREVRGTSRIMRSWAVIFANTPYIQFFLTDVDIVVSGDLAVVRCSENVLTSVADTGGDATALATNVFRRRAAGWRMWRHHGSPVLAGGEEP